MTPLFPPLETADSQSATSASLSQEKANNDEAMATITNICKKDPAILQYGIEFLTKVAKALQGDTENPQETVLPPGEREKLRIDIRDELLRAEMTRITEINKSVTEIRGLLCKAVGLKEKYLPKPNISIAEGNDEKSVLSKIEEILPRLSEGELDISLEEPIGQPAERLADNTESCTRLTPSDIENGQ